jgi:hypothetical protein
VYLSKKRNFRLKRVWSQLINWNSVKVHVICSYEWMCVLRFAKSGFMCALCESRWWTTLQKKMKFPGTADARPAYSSFKLTRLRSCRWWCVIVLLYLRRIFLLYRALLLLPPVSSVASSFSSSINFAHAAQVSTLEDCDCKLFKKD